MLYRPYLAPFLWSFASLLAILVSHSSRAELYWDTNGAIAGSSSDSSPDGNWGVANWSTDPIGTSATQAWVPGETAVLSAGTNGIGLYDITFSQNISLAGIRVEEGSPRLVSTSALNFTNGSLLVDTGSKSLKAEVLYGPTNGVITKIGSGTFHSERNQTSFAGKWIVNEGTLKVNESSNNDNALGITPTLVPDQITINNGAGVLGYGGPNNGITLGPGGGGFKHLDQFSNAYVGWAGPITGSVGAPFIVEVHGFVYLSNPNNNYDGDTILKDGIVTLGASEVLPNASNVRIVGPSALELPGTSETINSLSSVAGSRIVLNSTSRPTVKSVLTIQNPSGETLAGTISGTGGSIVKNGTGTLTVTGNNTGYDFVLNNGTVGMGHDNAFATGLTINGGTLANTSSSNRLVTSTLSINGDFTVDNSLNSAPGKLTFLGTPTMGASRTIKVGDNSFLSMDLRQTATGVGLTKTGTGTLELRRDSANSTVLSFLSGTINLVEGQLQFAGSPPHPVTGPLNFAGGTLSTIESLQVSGAVTVSTDSVITTSSSDTSSFAVSFTSNSFSGPGKLTVRNDTPTDAGQLFVDFQGFGATFAPGPIELANGAFGKSTLQSNHGFSRTQTFANEISGTGRVNIVGVVPPPQFFGASVLTAANTYSGGTTVSSGTLLVNNTTGSGTGSGPVFVNGAAVLGGTGTVAGAVTNAGKIAPGAKVGKLTLGSDLTMSAQSRLVIELDGATADQLAIAGNLDSSGYDFLDITGTGTGPWTIATYGGTLTGTFDNLTPGYLVDYTTNGQIILSSMSLPGDYNNDGSVDSSDYVAWRHNPLAYSGDAGYSALCATSAPRLPVEV